MLKYYVIILSVLCFAVTLIPISSYSTEDAQVPLVVQKIMIDRHLEEQIDLEKTAIQVMFECGADMSDAEKAVVASTISSIAMKTFKTKDRRESWLAVLAIESCFDSDAESGSGALGIGQVTFSTAKDNSKDCGLGSDIVRSDLFNISINGVLSACIFNKYIDQKNGSVTLALVGYNAGIHAKSIKKLDNLKSINLESANYIAKFSILMEKIRR